MNLYLIDGFSYIFRAFYAIPELSNSKGQPTGAIFGFTSMLLKLIRAKKPDALAIAFDSKEMTQREQLYSLYKAHRKVPPPDLTLQIDPIIDIVKSLGITTFAVPGYEADDILAKLALYAADKGADVFIVTGDKDMLQLVSPKIKIFDPMKNIVMDTQYVINRFTLPPQRVIEYLALTGDASDNIPGVKGIGEKTAKTLLSKVDSIDELMTHPENIPSPRFRAMISANIENIKLSIELLTLKTDMDINPVIPMMADIAPDLKKIKALFIDYELNSLLKYLPAQKANVIKDGKPDDNLENNSTDKPDDDSDDKPIKVIEITSIEEFNHKPLSGDISEIFISIGMNNDHPIFAFSIIPDFGYYFVKDELIEPFLKILKKAIKIYGHDFKSMRRIFPIDFKDNIIDTMLVSYLIDPNKRDYSFNNISLEYLAHISNVEDNKIQRLPFDDTLKTFGEEAAIGFRISRLITAKMPQVIDIYKNMEYPLLWVLSDMENDGISLDTDGLIALSAEIEGQIDAVSKRIYFHAGQEFNINSPKLLGKILFETLKLPTSKKIKTGYSTDIFVLENLVDIHPIAAELLEFRRLAKLKNTYIDPLPTHINIKTNRLHTTFNQTATATGRLSSTNPNLQNIPIRGEGGDMLRKAFIAQDGHLLISADYSQIELRVLAHLSGDVGMIEAFNQGLDIHSATGCEIFGVDEKSLTTDMRRIAKTVNFGVIYGQTPYGLAKTLKISNKEAKEYIERYFNKYSGVLLFIENTIKEATINGYTTTMMGRVRPIPELKSSNNAQKEHGQRQAINSPVQGSAADIIKIAMINVHKEIVKRGLKTRMILQIHDELLLETPDDEISIALDLVKELMEGACPMSVPLKVDIGSGKNWAEAH